jgi:hypothetical protein
MGVAMHARNLAVRILLSVAVGWVVCVAAGCKSKVPASGEVYGKVTSGGKQVTAGFVKFFPEGGGEPVSSSIGPDGSYRATGVPVGHAKVAIETLEFKDLTPPPPGIAKQLGGPRTKYVAIPAKYETAETSGLSCEVKKGAIEWDINLD